MIFSSESAGNFNVPNKIFLNNYFYSFSKHGTFKINNILGPDGGNAISKNKNLCLKKSLSEMLERRLLMPGTEDFINKKLGVNIIDGSSEFFYDGYIKYCSLPGYENDTTGTASHVNSETAIINAIKELFEKNSLYLFWFRGRGYKVSKYSDLIDPYFKNKYKKLYIFLNDDLTPYITCTIFSINNHNIIANGSGSSLDTYESIKLALEELDILYEQKSNNHIYNYIKSGIVEKFDQNHKLQIKHINSLFKELPEYNFNSRTVYKHPITINYLLKNIPSWINNIYVVDISKYTAHNLKTVRVFSIDLNNYIPRNILNSRNKKINYVFEKPNFQYVVPECPIL